MVSDIGIIATALISSSAMILIAVLSSHNYIKKKTFLHKLSQQKKIDDIKLNALRKELGGNAAPDHNSDPNNDLTSVINNIAQKYFNKDEDDDEGIDWTDSLAEIATNNPELVKEFVGKFIHNKKNDVEDKILGSS